MDSVTTSEAEGNVPDIHSLNLHVQELTGKVDFWNRWMLWSLVFAAIAALFIVITTRLAIVRAKELSIAQEKLSEAQNRQFSSDLRGKDEKIAEAVNQAATANERAAELEKNNLELRQKLANRRLTPDQHKILVDFLSKKPGAIVIESMGDSETGFFTADFVMTFFGAGWKISGPTILPGAFWNGIIVSESSDPDSLTVAEAFKAAKIPFVLGAHHTEKATVMIGGRPPMF